MQTMLTEQIQCTCEADKERRHNGSVKDEAVTDKHEGKRRGEGDKDRDLRDADHPFRVKTLKKLINKDQQKAGKHQDQTCSGQNKMECQQGDGYKYGNQEKRTAVTVIASPEKKCCCDSNAGIVRMSKTKRIGDAIDEINVGAAGQTQKITG